MGQEEALFLSLCERKALTRGCCSVHERTSWTERRGGSPRSSPEVSGRGHGHWKSDGLLLYCDDDSREEEEDKDKVRLGRYWVLSAGHCNLQS